MKLIEPLKKSFKSLNPPRLFSWQTLIFLCLFSWFMAFVSLQVARTTNTTSSDFVRDILYCCGWVFLIVGVDWWSLENSSSFWGFSVASWLTGILVSMFLFTFLFDELAAEFPSLPFVTWPLVSATIIIVHLFYPASVKYKTSFSRQKLIILVLSHGIISCWVQFHFLLQDWLHQYPSLMADNFARSGFVLKLNPSLKGEGIRGEKMLDFTEQYLKSKIEGKPWRGVTKPLSDFDKQFYTKDSQADKKQKIFISWKQVKQWLRKQPLDSITKQLLLDFDERAEDDYWYLNAKRLSGETDYTLELKAVWRGPTYSGKGYEVKKVCTIKETYFLPRRRNQSNPEISKELVGEVSCEDFSPLTREKLQPNQSLNNQ